MSAEGRQEMNTIARKVCRLGVRGRLAEGGCSAEVLRSLRGRSPRGEQNCAEGRERVCGRPDLKRP